MKIQRLQHLQRASLAFSALCLVLSGCAGGGSGSSGSSSGSTPVTTVGAGAAVTISAVSPTDVPVGASDVTLTVNGTGFASGATVQVNGVAEPTTFISATELRATVAAAQLKTGAVLPVSVTSGSTTVKADPAAVALSVDNPVPSLGSVSPAVVLLGSPDTTVTVTGTNFVQGVALAVNGTPRATTFVSATQLTVQLSASDFASAQPLPLNVINPKPGGGTSGTSALPVNNPAPAVTGLAPATVAAGAADTNFTLTGSGLLPSTVLQVNGATHSTTAITGTQLTFTLAAAELANAGTLAVAVVNPQPGGGAVAAGSIAVQNPVPAIATVAPTTLLAGSDATTVALTGTGFVKGSAVQVNGAAHASTYVSATEVDVPFTATELASSGTFSVAVTNAQPGGGISAGASIPVNNPVPAITALSPTNINNGATDTAVTITGTGFLPVTTLQVNGAAHAVSYVNSKQMSAQFLTAELASVATYNLTLTNPAPGGGSSKATPLYVGAPTPVITSLSPSTVPVGSAALTLSINGTGFLPTSTVLYGGYVRTATYVSSTQLTLPLTITDLAYDGSYSVAVINPAASGGTSKAVAFTIQAKTPVLVAISPSTVTVNGGPYILLVNGTNFTTSSKVLWNGTQLPTSYYSVYNQTTGTYSYGLQGTVSNDLLGSTGSATVTVSTATAIPATSNALNVTIANPPVPTVTGLSPNYAPVNADVKVTITGTGFTKNSVASYNGTALTTTFNSATTLIATVAASMLAIPGNGAVTVSTPAPGGGVSAAAALTIYLPVVSNNMVYNPVNGLAYLSIPSTGSTVTGNSIVSLDPATGALGTPIFVGSEPGVMAVSDDGKTLWVALNGSAAIRKVDLTASVAGPQYSIAAVVYSGNIPTAMLVLPGTSDSVAITTSYQLGLYDAGVLRGNTVSVSSAYALQADGTRKELYVGAYGLQAYTYGSTGLALKSSGGNSNYNSIASATYDEIQLVSGKIFTDIGRVFDSESAGLLGSFQLNNVILTGPTLYDAALSQVYVLNNGSGYSYNGYNQLTIFNPADYSSTGKSFQWNIPPYTSGSNYSYGLQPHRLTRWGANGLVLHTKYAIFTAQSSSVKDQSSVAADLSVAVSSSGGTTTGSTATYTATLKNSGPQPATDVAVSLRSPATGIIVSATAAAPGTCTGLTGCTFGTLAANASATVTVTVLQTTAGTGTFNVSVQGSSTDPDVSNNSNGSVIVVTGNTYNLTPTLLSISPNALKAGSADATVAISGTNFAAGSQVMLGTVALSTNYVSSTQLTATVPAANLNTIGWAPVSVTTPTPGGGTSQSLPLTVFNVVTVGLNHIVYEPYTRKLYASVSSGSSSVAANSVVGIDPLTAAFDTPITFATPPSLLTLSTSGKTLYAGLGVADASSLQTPLGRIDLTKGSSETINVPMPSGYYGAFAWNSIALQPGANDSVAVSRINGYPTLYDYAPGTKTLTQRGAAGSSYFGSCLNFLDSNTLLSTYSAIYEYPVSTGGLGAMKTLSTYISECFQLTGGTAVTPSGKVLQLTPASATQVGTLTLPNSTFYYPGTVPAYAVDPALGSAFIPGPASSTASNYAVTGLLSYDLGSFLRTGAIDLGVPTIEGSSNSSVAVNDLVRWGQDGLAMVTSTGHLYLLRGPFVVPQELTANTAAALSSSSAATLSAGTGNTLLTLTGTNFVPGVAVTWNGSYRMTTRVDATHVTVAIPATDLAAAGTGKLVATNPNATASNALSVTVQ